LQIHTAQRVANLTKSFLDELPYLDSFEWIMWKINIGNWHWVAVYHSPAPGSIMYYWDSLGSFDSRKERMRKEIGERINKVAGKLSQSWLWDEQLSFVLAPSQLTNSNDCGPAVNELGRRLMWNENLVDFDLAGAGKLLRAGQASEILGLIVKEGRAELNG